MITIVGLAGGPEPGGRTSTAISAVLDGVTEAKTHLVELASADPAAVAAAITGADAVVVGSPVYRATYSALLKGVLERTERGGYGESTTPLQGKVAATVLTGASSHHYLAMNDLRNVLAGFFAVQVLAPGLYLDHAAYVDRTTLTDASRELAAGCGAALGELTRAVRGSQILRAIRAPL